MILFLRIAVGLAAICSNWLTLLLNRLLGKIGMGKLVPVRQIRLRNGVRFTTSSRQSLGRSDLYIVWEMWQRQVYLLPGQSFGIEAGEIVFDIGANKGYFSVFAARRAGQVFAFEPMPENFTALKENLRLNSVGNVTAEQFAVSDKAGEQALFLSPNEGGHSMYGGDDQSRKITVQTVSLPEYCANHGINRIDFLKLDCEGAEYAILKTLPAEWFANIKKISMEHHKVSGQDPQELVQILKDRGFEILEFSADYIKARNKNI